MKTTKILSALLLLAVSLGLFKFAYVTSNGPAALAALIIGTLFIYSGLSLTMREKEYTGFEEVVAHQENHSKIKGICKVCGMDVRMGIYAKEPSFKDKIKKEIVRLNAVKKSK